MALIDICYDLRDVVFVPNELTSPSQIICYGALTDKDKDPCIVMHILNVLHIKYKIKDRVSLILENPKLDKNLFQEDLIRTLSLFKKDDWKDEAEMILKEKLKNQNITLKDFEKIELGGFFSKSRISYFKDGTKV